MTAPRETAIELLAQALQISTEQIGSNTSLGRTSQWDSLAHMRLILALETHLNRRLQPEEIVEITNLDDVVKLIEASIG